MKKIGILLLICIILVSVVSVYSYVSQSSTDQNKAPNITQNNNTQDEAQDKGQNSSQTTTKDKNITITYKGPNTPQKQGTYVLMSYTVANNGKNKVYDVGVTSLEFAGDEGFTKKIGTLNPGETKKFTYQMYIPTNKDLEEMFGKGTKLDNPWDVGGLDLSFKDDKGVLHKISSNTVKIKLLN